MYEQNNISELYDNRFDAKERKKKSEMWGGICAYFKHFLHKKDGILIDVAAGYCEFVNHMEWDGRKVAIDMNPDTGKYADDNVEVIIDEIDNISSHFEKGSASLVFMSNFLEHIEKAEISKLLESVYEILQDDGELWILTPNIKYVGGKYWDFYDHITPITDAALIEEAEVKGFEVRKNIKKFLPFTTKSHLPQAGWIVRLYLKLMPLSGAFFGEQSFLIFKK